MQEPRTLEAGRESRRRARARSRRPGSARAARALRGATHRALLGRGLVALCCLCAGAPLAAQAAPGLPGDTVRADWTIGLDARNGSSASARFAEGADFEALRALLVARGARVVPLATFGPRELAGLDLVLTQQPFAPEQEYAPAELAALRAFVQRGGALLLHGDAGGRSDRHVANLDALAAPFGVRFAPARAESEARLVRGLLPHPLTRGVTGLRLDAARAFAAVEAPAIDLTAGAGGEDVLAAAVLPGGGRVVLVGDSSCWSDPQTDSDVGLANAGNRRLLANLLDFLLPPRPARSAYTQPVGRFWLHLDRLRDAWLGWPDAERHSLVLVVPAASPTGRRAELYVEGARPGAFLVLVLGRPIGAGLWQPKLLATALADAEGRARFGVLVPAQAGGTDFGLRVLDPVSGDVSPVAILRPDR